MGRSASRVALRPLAQLTRLACLAAGGRLDVRMASSGDPDLGPLANSFNRTVAQLEHRVRSDSRFAADLSHELRTPLTTMLNSMEVIRHRRDQLPESVREPVDLLGDDLDRFRALVVDLLQISRHDASEDLVLDAVDVGDLVRRAGDRHHRLADRSAAQPPGLPGARRPPAARDTLGRTGPLASTRHCAPSWPRATWRSSRPGCVRPCP